MPNMMDTVTETCSIPHVEDRTRRIVDTAIELAEAGGFEAVRLRDVASQAGVALGTVYKRFPSKEDIMIAALERLAEGIGAKITKKPLPGHTPHERATAFFKTATRALCRRPNLTKAILRAVASGEPDQSDKVLTFHGTSRSMIVAALEGAEPDGKDYELIASLLQDVWFAGLVGWMGGLLKESQVVAQVRDAAKLLLAGQDALAKA